MAMEYVRSTLFGRTRLAQASPYTSEQVESAKRSSDILNDVSSGVVSTGGNKTLKRKIGETSTETGQEPPTRRRATVAIPADGERDQGTKLRRINKSQKAMHSRKSVDVFDVGPLSPPRISHNLRSATPVDNARAGNSGRNALRDDQSAQSPKRRPTTEEIQPDNGTSPAANTRAKARPADGNRGASESTLRQSPKPVKTARRGRPPKSRRPQSPQGEETRVEVGQEQENPESAVTGKNEEGNIRPGSRGAGVSKRSTRQNPQQVKVVAQTPPQTRARGRLARTREVNSAVEDPDTAETVNDVEAGVTGSTAEPREQELRHANHSEDAEDQDDEDNEADEGDEGNEDQDTHRSVRAENDLEAADGVVPSEQDSSIQEQDDKIRGKSSHRLDITRWNGAIILSGANMLWLDYHEALSEVYEVLEDQNRIRGGNVHVKQILKNIKQAESHYHKLEGISESPSNQVDEINASIERNLQKIRKTEYDLRPNTIARAGHVDADGKRMIQNIYVKIIPRLGLLLRKALLSRYEGERSREWTTLALNDFVLITSVIVRFCETARKWKPKLDIRRLIRRTQKLKVKTEALEKLYQKELRRHEFEQKASVRARRLEQARIERETWKMQRMREEKELARAKRELLAAAAGSWLTYPRPSPQLGRFQGNEGDARHTPAPSTPRRNGVAADSSEIGANDLLVRTPLSARVHHGNSRATDSSTAHQERRAKDLEWTIEEEEALLNALQEFQGESRYFDIFQAYSGQQLAGRDMDAIERKAKAIKATLINEMRGTQEYHDFDFLWSVSDS